MDKTKTLLDWPNQGLISPVLLVDQIFAFYRGGNGTICYRVGAADQFSDEQPLDWPGQSPGGAVYNDKLYIGFRWDQDPAGYMIMAKLNGEQLDPNINMGPPTSCTPALFVIDGTLYAVHQGGNMNGEMLYAKTDDGSYWSDDILIPNCTMSGSPSTLSHGKLTWVFHEGGGDNGELWCTGFNGESWTKDIEVTQNYGDFSCKSPSVFQFREYPDPMMMWRNGNEIRLTYLKNDGDLWRLDDGYFTIDSNVDEQCTVNALAYGDIICAYSRVSDEQVAAYVVYSLSDSSKCSLGVPR